MYPPLVNLRLVSLLFVYLWFASLLLVGDFPGLLPCVLGFRLCIYKVMAERNGNWKIS